MSTASRILTVFTRTPLHVGAGADVGAIDQPIVRERHTGLPIIPGSSLKGVFADLWHADTSTTNGAKREEAEDSRQPDADPTDSKRPRARIARQPEADVTWLFGSDDAREGKASAGALSFGEARLLAFPIRSAKGSFAWITSPLLLARAARDGVPRITSLEEKLAKSLTDDKALFASGTTDAPLALPVANGEPEPRIVLEDYSFKLAGAPPDALEKALAALFPDEAFRTLLAKRLVILSDGMMSHFARTACEVAQHVRINDATGTADDGGLFNQENVPADALFYAVVHATPARSAAHRETKSDPKDALKALADRLAAPEVAYTLQIGADATTGLGFCSVQFLGPPAAAPSAQSR